MKRSKIIYPLIAALIVLVAAVYAVDSNSKEASILPDLSGTTHITKASNQPAASLKQLNDAFVNIAKQTNPTVVTIRVKQTVEVHQSPFFGFFGNQPGGTYKQQRRGVGSGVIVSKDGYILTNNHVVQDADHIEVRINNNESYDGKVVGTDPLTDIAVVKVDAHNLPAIKMGNSDSLQVGSLVMAIGTPEDFSHSVTMGIVSAKDRHINLIEHGKGFENYIQTDAAINPGNSGGAMVNMNGDLVGINAAIYSKSGGNQGIGFAVPINLARSVMKQIIKNGKVTHAELGIRGDDINGAMAQGFGLKNNRGIIINTVSDGSAADKAGLKQGDVIKTLNGETIENYATFRTDIATSAPGRNITLGIIRSGKKKNIKVTLGTLDLKSNDTSPKTNDNIRKRLGFRVEQLTSRIAQQLDLEPGQQGVVISDVTDGSKAAQEGLQKGDVITKVNKQSVKNISDFRHALNKMAKNKNPNILLQIINRSGDNQFIAFSL